MMKNIYLIFSALCISFTAITLPAQSNLFIDNSYTVEEMVMDFFDNPEITISNVSYQGAPEAVAFFDAGGTNLGLGAGFVFSTGTVNGVADASATFLSESVGAPGDSDATALMGGTPSFDAAVIEFDFVVATSGTFDFNYVFGSEEYPEFTCTSFNDGFGFLVSGPGIAGPYANNAMNICMVPDSPDAVAINTINDNPDCGDPSYSQYYIDNTGDTHIVYDGLTVPMPASFEAVAGETYHAKLVVSDGSDQAFDTGVFLSFNSLGTDSLLVPPAQFSVSAIGTTVAISNTSKYARSWSWDFGNGVTSNERNPQPVAYDTPGTYTITLVTENFCCTDTYTTTVEVAEVAPLVVSEEIVNNPLACYGDNNAGVTLNISGGVEPYSIVWYPDITSQSELSAGTYEYSISDLSGLSLSGTVEITQPEELVLVASSTADVDGQENGSATVTASGGTAPYTYLWSNGETTATIEGLAAGDYTVEITDNNGCTTESTVTVDLTTNLSTIDADIQLSVYPNPAHEALFVALPDVNEIKSLSIVNLLGQNFNVPYKNKGELLEIDLSDYAQGVYHLRMENEHGEVYIGRFVVE